MTQSEQKTLEEIRHQPLPHSVPMEQTVLGGLMQDPKALGECLSVLTVDDFFLPRHQLVFRAVHSLAAEGGVCDVLTVTDHLQKANDLGKAGGLEYVFSLSDHIPTIENYSHYVNAVKEHARRRQLIRSLEEIIIRCYTSTDDVERIIELAAEKIYDVREENRGDTLERISTIIDARLQEMQKLAQGEKPKSINTYYHGLDSVLGGLRKGGLYILAARPGIGKSAFALNVARNVAAFEEDAHVVVFSLEMSKAEVANRLLISRSLLTLRELESLKVDDLEKWKSLGEAAADLFKTKLFIDDRSSISATEIFARCRQLKLEENRLDLVIIDYLQLMGSSGNRSVAENRQQQIAEISRTLKIMARELEVPVIALSQLNRELDKAKRQPRLADLRESGAIEQDADVVMFLHHPKDDEESEPEEIQEVELIVEKNRQGETRKLHLDWRPEVMTFYEPNFSGMPDEPAF